jgi:hypothetical protein
MASQDKQKNIQSLLKGSGQKLEDQDLEGVTGGGTCCSKPKVSSPPAPASPTSELQHTISEGFVLGTPEHLNLMDTIYDLSSRTRGTNAPVKFTKTITHGR